MADLSVLNGIYNHYLTSYAPKTSTSNDAHKKSELRGIYNSIVKINKDAPTYILDSSDESKAYAVGLKEDARELQGTLSSIGGLDEEELLHKKIAFSTNESIASAKYIGDSAEAESAPEISVEVKNLASPQMNLGNFIPSDEKVGLDPDTYSFDIGIGELNYEFQFQIRENDTNGDVQGRLQRLVNNADIGVKAEVSDDGEGNTSLKLTSQRSGTPQRGDLAFKVSDNQTSKKNGAVKYLGIDDVTRMPSNAEFVLNGVERTASSNVFTVEKTYELSLNGVSPVEGMTAEIGIKPDTENLMENMRQLFSGYNQFLRSTLEYTQKHPKSNQLVSEMWHIAGEYAGALSDIGVNIEENGTVSFDEDAIQSAIDDGRMGKGFDDIKGFAKDLYRKSNQVAINPMNYVEKTIVAYKKPGNNYATPYITSAYSGMMFNGYC